MSPSANSRHAAADSGGCVWHCSNDRHFVTLAATCRSELLLQIARRHGSRDGNNQRLGANFRSDLLQQLRHGLGLYAQQNDIGTFHGFAIVICYGDAELFRAPRSLFAMLHRRGNALRYKQSLLQVGTQ